MNLGNKETILKTALERRNKISNEKAAEYTRTGDHYGDKSVDVLANFKRVGEQLGLNPITVAGVYTLKQCDSIVTFINKLEQMDGKSVDEVMALVNEGEGIISRLDDLRNYADLVECILVDLEIHPDQYNA